MNDRYQEYNDVLAGLRYNVLYDIRLANHAGEDTAALEGLLESLRDAQAKATKL